MPGVDPAPGASPTVAPLRVVDAYKRFGGTQALAGVSLAVAPGTVHALLGANGSGKSTLIRALAGYHALDEGSVFVHGHELGGEGVAGQAKTGGLRFVHQDLALIPTLSVADNLALDRGYVRGRLGGIGWRSEYARVRGDLRSVGLVEVDPRQTITELGPVQRTLVAIARALDHIEPGRNVLVLDEPTARLPQEEAEKLISTLDALRRRGLPVLYITHRLEELEGFVDDVTVLRDGEVVFAGPWAETSVRDLRALIAGLESTVAAPAPTPGHAHETAPGDEAAPVLELRGVSSARLRGVDLTIRRGEVLGVTGVVGSGRSELGRVVYGVQNFTAGEIRISGERASSPRTKALGSSRVGYLPQERVASLLSGMTIEDNIVIASFDDVGSWYGVASAKLRGAARTMVERLRVRPADPTALVNVLSGGNQQKVALARWLRLPLDLLILDEPTQSIDVGTKADLMTAIRLRAEQTGLAVLWLESDIEELVKYADRIVVMSRGEITAEFPRPPFRVPEIVAEAYSRGAREED